MSRPGPARADAVDGFDELEVANASFFIDKLGGECGDLQGLRELTVNALEAIAALGADATGRVVWDVDWQRLDASGGRERKLSVIDTGTGMTPEAMRYYINHLAASGRQHGPTANFGVGAKVAAGSRNPKGLEYCAAPHRFERAVRAALQPVRAGLALDLDDVAPGCPERFETGLLVLVALPRHEVGGVGARLVEHDLAADDLVFREPLPAPQRKLLSADDWREYFDDDGGRRHEEVDLPIVDFCAVEIAGTIWSSNQWEDASHEFVFFARSSPEEIAEAIRGTEMDSSIFMEAGWERVDMAPPPALQIMEASIDVDLAQNAEHAFREGVAAFVGAYVHPHQLVTAVPQLFRASELLLKARLTMIDPHGLDHQPNNPTVLERLQAGGVALTADEIETITRRLRNDLQHGEAAFNHRAGLALCRRGVIWIDRFADEELGLWTGDVVAGADWLAMLEIDEVAARARRVGDQRVEG